MSRIIKGNKSKDPIQSNAIAHQVGANAQSLPAHTSLNPKVNPSTSFFSPNSPVQRMPKKAKSAAAAAESDSDDEGVTVKSRFIEDLCSDSGYTSEGDFIWLDGGSSQSKKLSHIHLFSVSDSAITGQMTIRNKEADSGGPQFNSAMITDDALRGALLEKFPRDAARQTRDDLFEAFKDLVKACIDFWTRKKADYAE